MKTMLVRLRDNRIYVGDHFSFSLQRTLRIPDDGRTYPLPPGLGRFTVHAVSDFADRVPGVWRAIGGFFVAAYQREALWIGFDAAPWKPSALKVGIGSVNAVSDAQWNEQLHTDPQDYLVCPPQLWLDGIHSGQAYVRQFVATSLGRGHTVEAQVRGGESEGGIQILVYKPKPGRFPDEPTLTSTSHDPVHRGLGQGAPGAMGLGIGGKMTQKIYPDPYGIDVWDQEAIVAVTVHIVNSEQYREITGQLPPPPPIDTRTYTSHGLPWFELNDEDLGDIAPTAGLERVKSIGEMLRAEDAGDAGDEQPVDVDAKQVTRIEKDGGWAERRKSGKN